MRFGFLSGKPSAAQLKWTSPTGVKVRFAWQLPVAAASKRFSTLGELNVWLAQRCRALWAELRHPEHKDFSVAEMLELERQCA